MRQTHRLSDVTFLATLSGSFSALDGNEQLHTAHVDLMCFRFVYKIRADIDLYKSMVVGQMDITITISCSCSLAPENLL